ncbi:multi-component regulatory system-8 [Streptomyces albus subsp. albus]|nr:multi-component regulatory system-8 [Streptomyces albus subsp. albus]
MTLSTGLPVRGAAGRKPARVRPYSLTGGRTRSGHVLLVETFVAAMDGPDEPDGGWEQPAEGSRAARLRPELKAIVELCRRMRSVAEISALLKIPLGVVRVLLSDLADQGKIRVYGTGRAPGQPDHALLERVLVGLRRL